MHHFYGSDLQFPHPERFVRTDGMKPELGHAGIFMLHKTIRQALAQLPARALRRIKLHVAEHAEGAQVVYPSHMVVMFVGKQHGVYTTEVQRQICWRKSGPQSNRILVCSVSTNTEVRKRLSRASVLRHTLHEQPICGTPVLVPVPKNVIFMRILL